MGSEQRPGTVIRKRSTGLGYAEQHFISENIGLICIWLWNTGNNSLLKKLIFPTLLLFSFLNELDSLSVPRPDGWGQETARAGVGVGSWGRLVGR